jgi:3-dehydroquinate dehydratase / shikimate dehydrogenase
MTEPSVIATLLTLPSPSGVELSSMPRGVGWLEVRADLLGDLDPDWLRQHFRGRLLYSLRGRAEGGECADSPDERRRRLASAARFYDRVELEAGGDLSDALLAEVPPGQRLISWHGPAEDLPGLKARFAQLSSAPAAAYKLVARATRVREEFAPLLLLKSLGREDTVAYADGPLGYWSRLAALHLGAPAVYGLAPVGPPVPAEPTVVRLIADYGLPALEPAREVFAIIGSPVFHSLSPRLHNAAYRATNHPALFLPLRVESFEEFWREAVLSGAFADLGLPINGMTVASPHKEAALATAGAVSPMARRAESANILVRENGSWRADTTDPEVIYMAGRERSVSVRRKRAAVIGCGGAGRAIAAALVESGAGVTLINRSDERGHHAAGLLGLPYLPLPDFDAGGYDIVVNATPVGRDADETPFPVETLSDGVVVIDLVYGPRPTPLIDSTLGRERVAIDGRDVLLTQVLRQFRLMTGREMPADVALETLGRRAPGQDPVGPARRAPLTGANVVG